MREQLRRKMLMRDRVPSSAPDSGFTLIEALVALAVLATGVAAICQLGFSTLAAARHTETRLALTGVARKAYAALPERRALGDGAIAGKIDGASWRMVSTPFPFASPGAPPSPTWTPQAVRLIVAGPSGGQIVIDTIRLRPAGAPR